MTEFRLGHTPVFLTVYLSFCALLFLLLLLLSPYSSTTSTFTMAPKKAPAAPKENVTLGPLAGDGMLILILVML